MHPDESPNSELPPDDHRALAARLDLCHFQDEAPAMVFWHPRGWTLYRLLEDSARAHVISAGYREVRTPQLLRRPVWERSGHWGKFHDAMFAVGDAADEAALKPVSCPGHIQLVRRQAPSWRDLPIRIAEFGLVHRDEPTGTLHGLMRLRQFTQDDGHVFCADDQVAAEVERFCRVPIASPHRARAAEVRDALVRAGVRARVAADDEGLARRIAVAHHDGVPFRRRDRRSRGERPDPLGPRPGRSVVVGRGHGDRRPGAPVPVARSR